MLLTNKGDCCFVSKLERKFLPVTIDFKILLTFKKKSLVNLESLGYSSHPKLIQLSKCGIFIVNYGMFIPNKGISIVNNGTSIVNSGI